MNGFSDAEIRALRLVIDEVRLSAPPDIDWQGLERRTLASIDAETLLASRTLPPRQLGIGAAFGYAMAAAALVMLLTSQGATPTPGTASAPRAEDGARADARRFTRVASRDGEPSAWLAPALPVGSRIVAGQDAARFEWPGVASWELGPGAVGLMAREGGSPAVVLEQGEIRVNVTPHRALGKALDTFVVEAAGARIAVHGTTFSVALDGERVLVEVVEGVVSVGPLGKPSSATDAFVRGPGRAAFSSRDGELLEVMAVSPSSQAASGASRGRAEDLGALHGAKPPSRPVAVEHEPPREGSRPDEPPTASPSAEVLEAAAAPSDQAVPTAEASPVAFSALRSQLVACLTAERGAVDPSLRVVASTDVRFRLDPEGRVATVRFIPPVRADLQQRCAAPLLGRVVEGGGAEPSVTVQFAPH